MARLTRRTRRLLEELDRQALEKAVAAILIEQQLGYTIQEQDATGALSGLGALANKLKDSDFAKSVTDKLGQVGSAVDDAVGKVATPEVTPTTPAGIFSKDAIDTALKTATTKPNLYRLAGIAGTVGAAGEVGKRAGRIGAPNRDKRNRNSVTLARYS